MCMHVYACVCVCVCVATQTYTDMLYMYVVPWRVIAPLLSLVPRQIRSLVLPLVPTYVSVRGGSLAVICSREWEIEMVIAIN